MAALGVRLREGFSVPRGLWRREKVRSGLFEAPVPKDDSGFHQQMVSVSCPEWADVSQRLIAESVVRETWAMGPYEPPARRLAGRKLFDKLAEEKTRRGKEKAVFARKRLYQRPEKKVVVPRALADCFEDCHERSRIEDGFITVDPCDVCDQLLKQRQAYRQELEKVRGDQELVDWRNRAEGVLKTPMYGFRNDAFLRLPDLYLT